MRKAIVMLAVLGLILALPGGPAMAGKKAKKVSDSFSAQLAPVPKLAAWGDPAGLTKPGCTAGQEGVHWAAHEFTAPGKGTLTASMNGFVGDHDLYLFDGDTALIASEGAQYDGSAPAEEEVSFPLTKGQVVTIVACNWLGGPDVLVNYECTFK